MTRLREIEESLESTIYYNSPNRHIDDLRYLIDKCKRLEKVREAAARGAPELILTGDGT